MMLKDGHVVPARSSIALQRGENNDTRCPDLDADPAWRCASSEPRAEHDGVGYQFCVYEKVKE